MSDPVVHFELPADDVDRAQRFYQQVFGWTTTPMPEFDYVMLGTAPTGPDGVPSDPGAINGGMTPRRGPVSVPVVTVQVDDIDAALRRVEQGGGRVVEGRRPVGDMGFTAYIADSEGNTVGLWQNP
ncbi:VOC family protein [Allonocardiopsis opalescens]|uniref:VOC domain-containing protein n=1 Tax=Allonocardiopsis opalescens TaxID=1144618 RepID=A0A2T0QE68_9ACTN|nr:VOC family protein [Allonocardiopsis opalescens]PRY02143.1 hypothetical protein CLV72_101743 [Allonocardiopsis opalescens]